MNPFDNLTKPESTVCLVISLLLLFGGVAGITKLFAQGHVLTGTGLAVCAVFWSVVCWLAWERVNK